MQHLLDEGRRRFAQALQSLLPIDGARIPEPGNTANMRLMVAWLTVCRCGPGHFAEAAVHAEFVAWADSLRGIGRDRSATAAIAELSRLQCIDQAGKLRDIALRVTATAPQ